MGSGCSTFTLEPSGSLDSSTEDLILHYEKIQRYSKILLPPNKNVDKYK